MSITLQVLQNNIRNTKAVLAATEETFDSLVNLIKQVGEIDELMAARDLCGNQLMALRGYLLELDTLEVNTI